MSKWISNIKDPNSPDASRFAPIQYDETREEAFENHKRWLADKIIGLPKGNEYYSAEQLARMDFVGVYKNED